MSKPLIALAIGACSAFLVPHGAFCQTPLAQSAFTGPAISGLSATRRVAIASVIVSFQSSAAGPEVQSNDLFAEGNSDRATHAMPVIDPALQEAVTTEAHSQLKADLTAAGFVVVPESEIIASAAYQQIAHLAETPSFKRYLLWASGLGGKGVSPNATSVTSIGRKLSGLDVKMAKELNAHVVKGFYVVEIDSEAQVGLLVDQSRITFRAPNGNRLVREVSPAWPMRTNGHLRAPSSRQGW